MANPQPDDAHLRIAHSITEAIMLRDFTKRQRKILDLILRLSWGCHKKYAEIPRQGYFEYIGIGKGHIKAELDWLQQSKVISIEGNIYSFNKNFDEWQISRVQPYLPEKVTELVTLNLNVSYQNGNPKDTEVTETVTNKLPKSELPSYQNGNFSTSEAATPKESIKESIKEIEINNILDINRLFTLWNSKNIIVHRQLTDEIRTSIKTKLRVYSADDLCKAISNYAEITLSPAYYWNHRWTFKDFLARGIEKFLDGDVARANYRTKEALGNHSSNPDKFVSGKYGHLVER
jgi:hypothetical protein